MARVADKLHPWWASMLALLLYLLLSVREMSAWTRPVWMVLAFAVIPGISAFALGRGGTLRERISASLWSVGLAMAGYTAFQLVRLHRGIGSTGDAGTATNVFFVILTVSVVYGVVAGVVCAAVTQLWARIAAKGQR